MSTNLPLSREQFTRWVHEVLNHLYDSAYIQKHPLTSLLLGNRDSATRRSQDLRRLLLEAIRNLRPAKEVPAQSADWRVYHILELRYIEGLSPTEAMKELALGRSQFFYEQARGLQAVSDELWARWQRFQAEAANNAPSDQNAWHTLVDQEAERLSCQAKPEVIEATELLADLRLVIESLARVKGIPVRHRLGEPPLALHADRVMLRQALLSIISYAMELAATEGIEIGDFTERMQHGLYVQARMSMLGPPSCTPAAPSSHSVDVCRQLMRVMGGMLALETKDECWLARLCWPTSPPGVLLVIDDNQDFVNLFRRYLTGYDWQIIGAATAEQARRIVAETCPTVIILDVLMPKEDGWELLMELRAGEHTREIPILVCSVLKEPQLARSLGAVAYLPKPVTQQALLSTLAPWLHPRSNYKPAR